MEIGIEVSKYFTLKWCKSICMTTFESWRHWTFKQNGCVHSKETLNAWKPIVYVNIAWMSKINPETIQDYTIFSGHFRNTVYI